MKAKICTYLIFSLCLNPLFSQKSLGLDLLSKDSIHVAQDISKITYTDKEPVNNLALLNMGSDLYTLQVFNYAFADLSFGLNTRLEEELPYEANSYDYAGFSYFDFRCNYNINDFSLSFSVENILNLNSNDFSIDPNLETSNGVTNAFYLSHEADATISFALAYNF